MYCDKAGLIERFGFDELERYAWNEETHSPDDARIARALSDAGELVNAYIGGVVTLPLSEPPAILRSIAADIARYRLQDDNPLDEAKERYDSAIKMLKDFATGKASLNMVVSGSSVYACRGLSDRVFTSETLGGF